MWQKKMGKRLLLLLVLTSCITGFVVNFPKETGSIRAYFCDQTNCIQAFINESAGIDHISCAIYDLKKDFEGILKEKNARLVVDEEHPLSWATIESGQGLMHDKFCVLGDKVWTGSWNPSQKMTIPNNVVVVESKALAEAYQAEFDELYSGRFHGGRQGPGKALFNGQLLEAYFCPEDDCKDHVLDVLKGAKRSIEFMTFSFTDNDIGDLLKQKSEEGVSVQGVFNQDERYGEYEKLKSVAKLVRNHHKVFIVDNETVITGSYNPTRNANEHNDENVIIIRDQEIARAFEKEFERLWKEDN